MRRDKKRANGVISIGLSGYAEHFCIVRCNFSLRSVLARQQYCCIASVSFRNHPNFLAGAGGIRRQDAKPLLDGKLILLLVFIRYFASIAIDVVIQKFGRRLRSPL
jgi:hypothetical protein